jgi:Tfp pilus assembly protein PilF
MSQVDIEELFLEGAQILTLKQFDKALEIFNQVLSLDPNHVKALEARAVIYMQKGELELAQKDLEKAIEIDPENARLYYRLGQIYYRKKDLDTALELFTKAIDLEPTYPAPYMARSQILREKGMEEAADMELDKAVAVQRELAKARKVVDF